MRCARTFYFAHHGEQHWEIREALEKCYLREDMYKGGNCFPGGVSPLHFPSNVAGTFNVTPVAVHINAWS